MSLINLDALNDAEQENAQTHGDVYAVRAHARGLENASFKIRVMRSS